MFQIIWNKDNSRWEIKDTSDFFVETGDTFHDYKFSSEEDAVGVYINRTLRKEEGFDLNYIREKAKS